jgi:hypothetical protein
MDDTTLESLYALFSFPDSYTTDFPNAVSYSIYTPENDRLQYSIDNLHYNLSDFMYTDSPQTYCASKKDFFLIVNIKLEKITTYF